MIEFLAANWLWIALVVAMVAMHRGGGCGSHGHDSHEQGKTTSGADGGHQTAHR